MNGMVLFLLAVIVCLLGGWWVIACVVGAFLLFWLGIYALLVLDKLWIEVEQYFRGK